MYFPKLILRYLVLVVPVFLFLSCSEIPERELLDLQGTWNIRLDPDLVGNTEEWYGQKFENEIILPGSTVEYGYGNEITEDTEWFGKVSDISFYTDERYARYRQPGEIKMPIWLTQTKKFTGVAWFQKEVVIPDNWDAKRVQLLLERAHWETRVWVDNHYTGSRNSLCAPHCYDLSKWLSPGKHKITISVDNRYKINVSKNAHSVSDHTQTNWNGLIGKLQLEVRDPLHIVDVQVYPDVAEKKVNTIIKVQNYSGGALSGNVKLEAFTTKESPVNNTVKPLTRKQTFLKGESLIRLEYDMGDKAVLWDEFNPNVYRLNVSIEAEEFQDRVHRDFGLREIGIEGSQFTMNGRKTFLRGSLECAIFPLTGYPHMDVEGWRKIYLQAKAHGLNHLRFHSWCPPEAAFTAADEEGFMLQVEAPVWPYLGEDEQLNDFIYAEGDRILREYGNHPSFTMLCVGNEIWPRTETHKRDSVLRDILHYWKSQDERRLYTSGSGWPYLEESDFHVRQEPRIFNWLSQYTSRLDAAQLDMRVDYADLDTLFDGPVISHEIGQWVVYPNFAEINKYTGVTRAYNFEIARDFLEENHMGEQWKDMFMASGRFQSILYKEEIEAVLRTPGHAGFQLLDIHDFPGQGTATVGILDAFWDEKGYISPEEFRHFCNVTVPLMRVSKMTWVKGDTIEISAEVSHFGPEPIENALIGWTLSTMDGTEIENGELGPFDIQIGNENSTGNFEIETSDLPAPSQLKLEFILKGTDFMNSWNLWIYPADPSLEKAEVMVCHKLDQTSNDILSDGGKVLLLIHPDSIPIDKAFGFAPIFWNRLYFPSQPTYTLGLLCDPAHPVFEIFPTEYHSNWQWWDVAMRSNNMILDEFDPALSPLIQPIDDWNTARRLGILYEVKMGEGKLMVSSMDLSRDLENRPEARQMLSSILNYMNSEGFDPKLVIDIDNASLINHTLYAKIN
ncbi:MAG TPA: hypothetical protein ENI20_00145 [Bacteroides sp.]|nr:hypothetical protein [Bacteroides sp.]